MGGGALVNEGNCDMGDTSTSILAQKLLVVEALTILTCSLVH